MSTSELRSQELVEQPEMDTPINSTLEGMDEHAKMELVRARSIDRMDLWNKVSTTDPSATKNYKGAGGFAGTAISSLYPIKVATEYFGPCGLGWGYDIIDEQYIKGAPIVQGDLGVTAHEQTHTLRVRVWGMFNGEKASIEHYGQTPHIYTNKYGVQTDHEAPKKSLTDAIKKTLTMWGFSADVFMGLYDDPEYVASLEEKEAVAKSDNKDAEQLKQAQAYNAWKTDNLKLITNSVGLNELQALFVAAVKKANRKNDEAYIKVITKAKDKRKAELQEKVA